MRGAWIGVVVVAAACGGSEGATEDDGGGTGAGGPGTPCAGAETHTGEATYYDFADGSGNCGFPATPNDLLVAAMNHTDYADSAACGACVRIAGPDGGVDVRIVDRCPECPAGDIDLSPEAFALIAPIEAGRVAITWEYIACPVSGPVVFHFKDGSNEWWTAVQMRNHRHAIATLAYQADGGSFVDVERLDYNYFVEDAGMGPGPFTFRITDVTGETLEQTGIAHAENSDVSGDDQFPACAAP
ncbi:MAG: expansin EXLX1 family cellulose-binding protein [Polyangiaceae bacterium]